MRDLHNEDNFEEMESGVEVEELEDDTDDEEQEEVVEEVSEETEPTPQKEIQKADIDMWERSPEEAYIYAEGSMLKINIEKVLKKSHATLDKDKMESVRTLFINLKVYYNKINFLAKYIDYFLEKYDTEKELLYIYMVMKDDIDNNPERLTSIEIRKKFLNLLFCKHDIKEKVYRLVEDNYMLDVTVDKKTGRTFLDEDDFTNLDTKKLLAISMMMKLAIPILVHYMEVNSSINDDDMSRLIISTFVEIFHETAEDRNYSSDYLMTKLYNYVYKQLKNHNKGHNPLWHQQAAIKAVTPDSYMDLMLKKHLLSANLFKFNFSENVISLLKTIVDNQLVNAFVRIRYKLDPVRIDTAADDSGLSSKDKLEQTLSKMDETQIIKCELSTEQILHMLEESLGEIDPMELDFYMDRANTTDKFLTKLRNNYYANLFDGFMELESMELEPRIKLMIYMKRALKNSGMNEVAELITSIPQGKTRLRMLASARFTAKLEGSEIHKDLMDKKYPDLKNFRDKEITLIISHVMNNTFTYLDYYDQSRNGEVIEFNEDIVSHEIQVLIDNI